MNLDHLGTPLRPMTRLYGKGSNRMYRLDTSDGSFAVKALMLDRDSAFRHDDVFRLELAAFAAGIPMPRSLPASTPSTSCGPMGRSRAGRCGTGPSLPSGRWSPHSRGPNCSTATWMCSWRSPTSSTPANALGPVVLTHRDIHPWNLLARSGRPIILDWEISGMLDLAGELGSTALSLSKGPGFDDIDPAVFRSVLVSAGRIRERLTL